MLDRLTTDPEVVVRFRGPATVGDQSAGNPRRDSRAGCSAKRSGGPALVSWVPTLGVLAWSFVGFVGATIIVVLALGAVNEIILPLMFAAVLTMIFQPVVEALRRPQAQTHPRRRVVLDPLVVTTGLVPATVRRGMEQTDQMPTAPNRLSKACSTEVAN
jgi:putative heme transporter